MLSWASNIMVAANLTLYPGLVDRGARIEAMVDRGPIVELIIRCHKGTAIVSFSKVDKRYCDPHLRCARRLKTIVRRSCN